MVGPGIAPVRLNQKTLHVDVLPSLLHALSGKEQQIPHTHGLDWFGDARRLDSLEAHSPMARDVIRTQLRSDGLRLRMDLQLRRPHVTLLGFEDELGRLMPAPQLSQKQADGIAGALEEQFLTLRL
jgi:hypothetical protein